MKLLLILLLPTIALAQVDMETGAALLKPVLELLLGLLPESISAVLLMIGGLRVVMKPLMALLEAVAIYTPTKKDDELYKKVSEGNVYKTFKFVLDWLASVKLPTKTK